MGDVQVANESNDFNMRNSIMLIDRNINSILTSRLWSFFKMG